LGGPLGYSWLLWLLAVSLLGAGPPGGLSQVGGPFDGQASCLVSGV